MKYNMGMAVSANETTLKDIIFYNICALEPVESEDGNKETLVMTNGSLFQTSLPIEIVQQMIDREMNLDKL